MPSNLRRLAADHAALHGDQLPPYYLLPPDNGHFAAADDLTQFNVLLAGPPGTPYSLGLWRLHLKMPEDYPNSPPKATFRTRIWHPNVEELSGAVCVDTLKRDWQPKLTLRDVLITISCLLIHPNPDSALNSSAGTLLREDYEAFAHQAKLMTSIHAVIPSDLKDAVKAAKHRGEDPSSIREEQDDDIPQQRQRKQQRLQTGTTRKPNRKPTTEPSPNPEPPTTTTITQQTPGESASDSENDDPASASKENDPSLSPTSVRQAAPPSPRKSALGKRPLSVLAVPYPEDPDADMMLVDSESEREPQSATMTTSERNISANRRTRSPVSPVRKSPKLTLSKGANASVRLRDDLQIYEDVPDRTVNDLTHRFGGDGKENRDSAGGGGLNAKGKGELQAGKGTTAGANVPTTGQTPAMSTSAKSPSLSARSSSKVSNKVVGNGARKVSAPKAKPRIGIRRL